MMRLDKLLAHAGYGTRKEVKQLIKEKRVRVNDSDMVLDKTQVDEFHDEITVDGIPLTYEKYHFIMLNKPQGVVSAKSDSRYPTVMDCIDVPLAIDMFPIGRLDLDTEGLILIANDGKLAHYLLSPRHHVPKCYEVHLAQPIGEDQLATLKQGVQLQDVMTKPAQVRVISDTHIELTITEGKYHQVKRMMQAVGNEVIGLKRLSFGSIVLDENLASGAWRYLTETEVNALYDLKNRQGERL